MTWRVWSLAVVGSVSAHGAALAALVLSVEPDALPEQTRPRSQFSIATEDVTRRKAAPEPTQGTPAAEGNLTSTGAVQGQIAQTTAPSVDAVAKTVSTVTSAGHNIVTAALRPIKAQAVAGPVPQVQALNPTRPVTAARLIPSSTRKAVSPEVSPVTGMKPDAAPVVLVGDAETQVPQIDAPARTATEQALPAVAGKAELAWQGEGATAVSAQSLAAIAAFTRPGDLTAQSQGVRDGIAGLLSSVPCSRLQTTFVPETGQLELRGHIPEDALRGPILAALRDQIGDAIPMSDEVLILPRPQCGALAGIADIGLPQSTEQLTNPRVIGADGFARTFTYSDGQRLSLDLQAPDYDSYVYVDYFVTDGSVIHLQPNEIVPLEFTTAKSALSVGRDRGDKPSLQLTIGAPYGQEIAAAFATSEPLYYGLRPIQEPAEPYLAFLKDRVAAKRAENPDFKGEWVYFFITTQP